MNNQKPRSDEPRVNNQINSKEVRLVDQNGEMIGVVPVRTAMEMAEKAGLDLVEVSPGAEPPVCKILDYGKYKYEAQKKAHEARKKQKVILVKEIKLRPNIDTHDLNIKIKQMIGFIEEGDKVRVAMRFRGREMAHQDIGMKVLQEVQTQLGDRVKIEQSPKFEGRGIVVMLIGPVK